MGVWQTMGRWCAQRRWLENWLVSVARRFPGSPAIRCCCNETADEILRRDRAAVRVAYTGYRTYVSVPMDTEQGRQIYFFDHDQSGVAGVVQKLVKPGQTWVDANAGLGYITMIIARELGDTGKVFVFESRTEMNERLRSSIVLNGLTNITLVPLVAGGSTQDHTVALDQWIGEQAVQADALRVTTDSADVFLGMQQTLQSGRLKLIVAELTGSTAASLKLLAGLDFLPHGVYPGKLVPMNPDDFTEASEGSFVLIHRTASDLMS